LGDHVLDLGCGPGFASFDLATLVGNEGKVTGFEISQSYVDYANRQARLREISNTEFIQGSVYNMPFAENQFDIVYCRWVLSWVRNVPEIITAVSRILKPGGVFLIQEYAHWGTFRLEPDVPEIRKVVEACRQSWRIMDSEIDIAPSLPNLFVSNHLTLRHHAMLEKVSSPRNSLWQWPKTFLHVYASQLIQMGLLTNEEQQAFEENWPMLENDPSAFFISPMMMEFIAQKVEEL
jgi:ubiquinone/menaquinone biosynthesis C-methylase UbiE